MTKARNLSCFTLALMVSAAAYAQKPITRSETTKETATIQAIDSTTRSLTLRNKDGEEDTFRVGPDMTRFNELKVGDRIDVTYVESLVLVVHKAGTAAPTATTGDAALTRGQGARPSGTIAAQVKTTVTVKAVNPSVPSITVLTADGRTVTRKVEDKKNLEGVQVGDKIEITYTEALLVSVASAK
jgi:Cu/Ag efflux protein CusF